MDIINRDQLSNMPDGTVFMKYSPDYIDGRIRIITGKYTNKLGFNGVLYLEPNFQFSTGDPDTDGERITNWCSTDETEYDYDENQLFVVFSKTEVRYMINILMWALSGCSYCENFSDKYICGDVEIDEEDLDKYTDNTMGLTWA